MRSLQVLCAPLCLPLWSLRLKKTLYRFSIFDDQFSMINFQFSNNFEEGIGVGGGEEFIDPEYGIEFFGAGVGNIVGVPDGHVDEGRGVAG